MKKSAISINMLIMATIAIIALVLMIIFFYNNAKTFNKDLECQADFQGTCININKTCEQAGLTNHIKQITAGCQENQACCVPVK